MRTIAVTLLLLATTLSGCTFLDELNRPDLKVSRTPLGDTNERGYVTDPVFSVTVLDKTAYVVITAKSDDGRTLRAEGTAGPGEADQVIITLEDGTWDVSYTVDDFKWETFRNVKVDVTPPSTDGIEGFGQGSERAYTIGAGYTVDPDVDVEVRDASGAILSRTLPVTVRDLDDGVHFFLVLLTDSAGNQASVSVQVTAGEAKALPEGKYTFGIVARYTNEARLWDLSDMDAYLTPAQAAQEAGGWLGDGAEYGLDADHSAVQAAVDEALAPGDDTTMEIAWALYEWLYDNLEYDEERLDSQTLMLPHQVIEDAEDPDAETGAGSDDGDDGLADDGPGNGVRGGVCRDLAATYISMLRAAGVPARLVSGYLAGNVDGFHAWVEFYAGSVDGQEAWVPVDVSPIDGSWDTDQSGNGVADGLEGSLQAFGIQLPQYLALRKVPDEYELPGWSTALGASFSYPQSSSPPEVSFQKDVVDEGSPVEGVLCFDPNTLYRRIVPGGDYRDCEAGSYYIGVGPGGGNPFITGTQRLIDYGIQVSKIGANTEITMTLSYPFHDDVAPDSVDWAPYSNPQGMRFSQDDPDIASGKLQGVLSR